MEKVHVKEHTDKYMKIAFGAAKGQYPNEKVAKLDQKLAWGSVGHYAALAFMVYPKVPYIMVASKEANVPVPFTITAKAADGGVIASVEFSFDADMEKLYLIVTADGRIMEDKDCEG